MHSSKVYFCSSTFDFQIFHGSSHVSGPRLELVETLKLYLAKNDQWTEQPILRGGVFGSCPNSKTLVHLIWNDPTVYQYFTFTCDIEIEKCISTKLYIRDILLLETFLKSENNIGHSIFVDIVILFYCKLSLAFI